MWRQLAAMRRWLGLGRPKRSSRVADESCSAALGSADHHRQGQGRNSGGGGWGDGLSALLAIVGAPLAAASCLAGRPDGMEEVWASGERPRTAEMDHLMVRDSMRYAIYV